MKTFRISPIAALTALALSACTMAPSYERPTVAAPAIPAALDATQIPAADLAWQNYFIDPRLQTLIATALQNNTDLRLAALNADAARAQYGIAFAGIFPTVAADGSLTRARTSKDIYGASAGIGDQYQVGLGVAAWEFDLFGRVRSMSNAAKYSYFSARHSADAARISLIAAVAKSYFAEKSAEETMRYAEETLKTREESHNLAKLSYEAGVISAIDLNQSLSQIEAAKVSHAAAQTARDAARNALAVLVGGRLPENLPEGRPLTMAEQFASVIPAGLPSDLLNRRPDIRAAEADLQSANAQIGAARAAFFPSISLTGSVGTASYDLDRLFEGPAATWSFIPKITLPIFTWGSNKANLDLAHVRKNIAVARYEQTVQNAFRDASDALNAYQTIGRQVAAQEKIAAAGDEVLRLTDMRYQHGIADSLDLLDARRQSFTAQTSLIDMRLQQLNNRVDLYKVFGGGLPEQNQTSSAPAATEKSQLP